MGHGAAIPGANREIGFPSPDALSWLSGLFLCAHATKKQSFMGCFLVGVAYDCALSRLGLVDCVKAIACNCMRCALAMSEPTFAGVMELVDIQDLKS